MKNLNNPTQLQLVPRCGAKTRKQTPCMAPAVKGNKRCRMHGGKGSGAPKGSQNALKHGFQTNEAQQLRREVKLSIEQWNQFQKTDNLQIPFE